MVMAGNFCCVVKIITLVECCEMQEECFELFSQPHWLPSPQQSSMD